MRLGRDFYCQPTLSVARQLLGKTLVSKTSVGVLEGEINEVESYIGEDDLASHARVGKTHRTQVMYYEGGYSYVYLIYGMYYCFNVVTERTDYPSAILIRSIIPTKGIILMHRNRKVISSEVSHLTNGPGKLCQALGITKEQNAIDLTTSKTLYIEDRGKEISTFQSTPRIGISQATEKRWRFVY
ncbi:DNA-3-methyladenine glycosylase [Candidatus Woesebacteria bacterium]|nr:DNA-3-methyladenine glycosylase [Candidatus Woesebacteria bacterium]